MVDQVASDGCGVDRPGGLGAVAACFGEPDLDAAIDLMACEQAALFHAGHLVGQSAAMPAHRFGEGVLAHTAVTEFGYSGQYAEVRIGQADGGGDVRCDPGANSVRREFPGVPERHLLGIQRLGHSATLNQSVLTRQHGRRMLLS